MKWGEEMIEDQTGKSAIVTGCNTGIGYYMVRALASKGASVTMAVSYTHLTLPTKA